MSDLTYDAVGDSLRQDLVANPPRGYRAVERRVTIASRGTWFTPLAHAVMTWELKLQAGFDVRRFDGDSEFVSSGPVEVGEDARVTFGPIRETVRVVRVVDEPRRRGFAYGTLREHPLRGEEAFLVEWRDDDTVQLVIRSFSRPSSLLWWVLYPALLTAQRVFLRRYKRALAVS